MALVKCKECQTEVSDKAYDCPNCGAILRKPKRTIFGKIIKFSFIGFNILMLIWIISGIGTAAESVGTAASEAEQAGAAIGTGLGVMFIVMIWAVGDFILGLMTLFTRPKKS